MSRSNVFVCVVTLVAMAAMTTPAMATRYPTSRSPATQRAICPAKPSWAPVTGQRIEEAAEIAHSSPCPQRTTKRLRKRRGRPGLFGLSNAGSHVFQDFAPRNGRAQQ